MSRRTFIKEDETEIEIIESNEKCRYMVNGKCYNNKDYRTLGKVCHKRCINFLSEE